MILKPNASTMLWMALPLILIFAVSPILVAVAAGLVGASMGCRIDEGGVYPCPVLGFDLGGVLAVMFVCGWFFVFTIPLGAVAALVWLGCAVAMFFRRDKQA